MMFLSACQFKSENRKDSRQTNADFPSYLPVKTTQSGIDGDSRLPHPHDVDIYFVVASGVWPAINSNRASTQDSIPDACAFSNGPESLTRPSQDSCHLCDQSQFPCPSTSDQADVNVLPVAIPLAGRISQQHHGEMTIYHDRHHQACHHARSTRPHCMARVCPMPTLSAPMVRRFLEQKRPEAFKCPRLSRSTEYMMPLVTPLAGSPLR